ncbi:MAG: hypothetical protein GXO63_01175 [Candidatus Micrarchaeota archaeon]|nr:hypothetical protein [Candidatus Micrarchaeota archaeon]
MLLIVASGLVAFLVTFALVEPFSRFLIRSGIYGYDVHKRSKKPIPEMGGPPVIAGFLTGVFFFIGISVFVFGKLQLTELFAGITTILIITIIGILDDIGTTRAGLKRLGLKQWQKPLLTLPAALPLMAVMAGDTNVSVPFIGPVDVGILYPLVLIPLAIIFCSNVVNMLGGFNGLEAGLGFILFAGYTVFGFITGNTVVSLISITIAAALLAFLIFNWYPAKIFPGDSLPYSIGAAAAVVAILGNIERFVVLTFALYFVEFFLKLRSGFKAECFGKKGKIVPPKGKISSVTHIVMKLGLSERGVVLVILGIQALIMIFAFIVTI